jgi:hypothetical protein
MLGTDLLSQAIARARPLLAKQTIPLADRLQVFWAVVKHARDLAAWDVHESEFLALARETGLTADLGHDADQVLQHIISCARRGLPFDVEPRQ